MVEMLADIAKEIDKLPIPDFNFRFAPGGIKGIKLSISYHDNYLNHRREVDNGKDPGKKERERTLVLNGVVDFDSLMKPKKHHKSSVKN